VPRSRQGIKGLGAKYGGTLRKRIFRELKAARECPSCSSMKLARTSSGVWKCKSCGYTVAGGAFELKPAKAR
jgi:large subunit ribosomal protein L37Ae